MNIAAFFAPIQHLSFAIDDSTLAVMALLAGMIGGWKFTGWREQLKAKRVRIEHKTEPLRKQD
jgi:hypothetical protein